MVRAGCYLQADLTQFAVMWSHAFSHLRTFVRLIAKVRRVFRQSPPTAVILVDFPGFNWWVARLAKRAGLPVYYFVPPQIWAWARWRVRKMRRLVDLIFSCLPFEEEFFREHGCRTILVGHPFFDHLSQQSLDQAFLNRYRQLPNRWITLLPGSRDQEVEANLGIQLLAVQRIASQRSDVQFLIAAFNERQAAMARGKSEELGVKAEVWVGKTNELIHLADCCVATSGSVSLELLYHRKPAIILYRVSPAAYLIQGLFRQVPYIALVNLLAAREPLRPGRRWPRSPETEEMIYPEFLTCRDPSAEISAYLLRWLDDPEEYARRTHRLQQLAEKFAHPGAVGRAAEILVSELSKPQVVPPPHFNKTVQTRESIEKTAAG